MAIETTKVRQSYVTYQGDTWEWKDKITDKDTGDAIDISGWQFWFTLKAGDEVKEQVNATDIDRSNGEYKFVLSHSVTKNLSGDYKYDMRFATDDSPEKVKTFQEGIFTFEPATEITL